MYAIVGKVVLHYILAYFFEREYGQDPMVYPSRFAVNRERNTQTMTIDTNTQTSSRNNTTFVNGNTTSEVNVESKISDLQEMSHPMRLSEADLLAIRTFIYDNYPLDQNLMRSMEWVEEHCREERMDVETCALHLDKLIGDSFLTVAQAHRTLNLLAIEGFLKQDELDISQYSRMLNRARSEDRLSIHSLSNIIRDILHIRNQH